jgi:hypothetical protein
MCQCTPQANESIIWSGKCKNGFADKSATLTFLTNAEVTNVYQGEMKRGKSHGKGKFILENGDAYEGNFYNANSNNKRNLNIDDF